MTFTRGSCARAWRRRMNVSSVLPSSMKRNSQSSHSARRAVSRRASSMGMTLSRSLQTGTITERSLGTGGSMQNLPTKGYPSKVPVVGGLESRHVSSKVQAWPDGLAPDALCLTVDVEWAHPIVLADLVALF